MPKPILSTINKHDIVHEYIIEIEFRSVLMELFGGKTQRQTIALEIEGKWVLDLGGVSLLESNANDWLRLAYLPFRQSHLSRATRVLTRIFT